MLIVENYLFEVILIFVFILLNAFFVAVEFAIIRSRNSELDAFLKSDSKRIDNVKRVKNHIDVYISATQLGITVVNLLLGWIGDEFFSKLLSPLFALFGIESSLSKTLSVIIGLLMITYLTVILGEQVPKGIAIRYPKELTIWLAYPIIIFYRIFKPFILFLNYSANGVLRIMGIQPVTNDELYHSEEEIRYLIAEGRKTGVIDSTEHQLIEKIFDFNDKIAKDIMIPRNNMVALDIDDKREKILQIVIEEGYSRIPVYKDTIDNIIGVIYSKDLISAAEHKELILLTDILRSVLFIPETKHIGEILKDFQKKHIHLGVVVNEHGGIEGLVTLEDIIEEIVGEIEDEYDIETRNIQKDKLGIYLVNPMISIDEFNKKFNLYIPVDTDNYLTLSGFLETVTGHVPEIYERIDYQGSVFTVMKKTGNKLLQIKIQRLNL